MTTVGPPILSAPLEAPFVPGPPESLGVALPSAAVFAFALAVAEGGKAVEEYALIWEMASMPAETSWLSAWSKGRPNWGAANTGEKRPARRTVIEATVMNVVRKRMNCMAGRYRVWNRYASEKALAQGVGDE